MRILALWIGVGLCLAIGVRLGSTRSDLGVWLTLIAVALAGVAVARASSAPGGGRRWLVLAGLVLGVGRGALAVAEGLEPGSGARGQPRGLLTFEVDGASEPGPRCRVRVWSGVEMLWLDAPSEACPLAAGQRVRVRAGGLRRRVHPELPGDPSPVERARGRGARASVTVDRLWPAGGTPHPYWAWVARQRHAAWTLSRGDGPTSFVVAAALGVRSALAPSARRALRRAGLGHLIAVSGLHVGLAAWALLALAMRIGGGLGWGVVLSWGPLGGYVLLTGASPPAVRAGLMVIGVGLGGLLGRPHHGPVLLAATAVAMLTARPAWALDPGFQLSVAAMATLVRAPPDQGMLAQTWRVTWVVLPLSLWHFGHAGIWGLCSNVVAVPVFTLWVLPLGLVGWCVVPWFGPSALAPAAWGADLVLSVAEIVSRWPALPVSVVGAVGIVAAALGLLGGRRGPHGELRAGWCWLPPMPVALAVVVAGFYPRPASVAAGRWWALGSARAPAIVTVARPEGRTLACVHRAGVAPSRWRGLLDALGVDAAGWGDAGEPGGRAPHERALRQRLRAQHRWVEPPVGCPAPPSSSVARGALERCRRRAGTPMAMVVADDDGVRCFAHGAWAPLESVIAGSTGNLLSSTPSRDP